MTNPILIIKVSRYFYSNCVHACGTFRGFSALTVTIFLQTTELYCCCICTYNISSCERLFVIHCFCVVLARDTITEDKEVSIFRRVIIRGGKCQIINRARASCNIMQIEGI